MTKIKLDILTIGGATRDITFYTKEGEIVKGKDLTEQKMIAFDYGAKMVIDEVYYTAGGGACNTAIGLSKLGLKTGIISALGKDDNGHDVLAELNKNKVDTSMVRIINGAKTAFSFVVNLEKSKEHILFTYRGASTLLETPKSILAKVQPKWIYITSLSEKNWKKDLDMIFTYAMDKGIKTVWNPGNKQFQAGFKELARYLSMADVFIVNRDEATELVSSAINSKKDKRLKDIKFLFNELKNAGVNIAVITDGPNGAYGYDEEIFYAPIYKEVARINTAGVGDAFGSAFLAGYIYKQNIVDALKWGIINSAFTTSQVGAHKGLLKKGQIESLVGKVKVSILR